MIERRHLLAGASAFVAFGGVGAAMAVAAAMPSPVAAARNVPVEIRLIPDASFERLGEAADAISGLGLDAEALDALERRLRFLVSNVTDFIEVDGECRPTVAANVVDLGTRLAFPEPDEVLLAALRAKDAKGVIRHLAM